MSSERVRDVLTPWAGIGLSTLGGALAHQVGAYSTFQDCRVGSPLMVIAGAVAGLVLVSLGAFWSWQVLATDRKVPARRLIASVSLMCCTIFALAIILPIIASLVIPRCVH